MKAYSCLLPPLNEGKHIEQSRGAVFNVAADEEISFTAYLSDHSIHICRYYALAPDGEIILLGRNDPADGSGNAQSWKVFLSMRKAISTQTLLPTVLSAARLDPYMR